MAWAPDDLLDEDASFAAVPLDIADSVDAVPEIGSGGSTDAGAVADDPPQRPVFVVQGPPVFLVEQQRVVLSEAVVSKSGFQRSHLAMLWNGVTPRGTPATRTERGEVIVPNCTAALFKMLIVHILGGQPLEKVDLAEISDMHERLLAEIITWKLPRFPLTLPTRLWTSQCWSDLSAFYVMDSRLVAITAKKPVAIQVGDDPTPTALQCGRPVPLSTSVEFHLPQSSPSGGVNHQMQPIRLVPLTDVNKAAPDGAKLQAWEMAGCYWVLQTHGIWTTLFVHLPRLTERVVTYQFPPFTEPLPTSGDYPVGFFHRRDNHFQAWFSSTVGVEVLLTRQTNPAADDEYPVKVRITQTQKSPIVPITPSQATSQITSNATTPDASVANAKHSTGGGHTGESPGEDVAGSASGGATSPSTYHPASSSNPALAGTDGGYPGGGGGGSALSGWITLTGRQPIDVKPKWVCYHPELSSRHNIVRYASTTKFHNGTKNTTLANFNPSVLRFYPWGCLAVASEVSEMFAVLLIDEPDLSKLYGPKITIHLQSATGIHNLLDRDELDVVVNPDLSRTFLLLCGQLSSQPIVPTSNKVVFELVMLGRFPRTRLCHVDISDGSPFKVCNSLANLGLLAEYDPSSEIYYQAPIARTLCPRFDHITKESLSVVQLS